jgi:hypothetical protein
MNELVLAILQVMKNVEYMTKDDQIGSGSYAYKAITDEKVRRIVREHMINAGLVIFQIDINPDTSHERWEEVINQKGDKKMKHEVFSECVITYRLMHTSGQYIDLKSLGHGVDSSDKSPGKAMTYAMKYILLNTFLIPTGDDPDKFASEERDKKKVEKKEEKRTTAGIGNPGYNKYQDEKKVDIKSAGQCTLEEITAGLYKGHGKIDNLALDTMFMNWKQHDGSIHFGKYVSTVGNSKRWWWIPSEEQMKKFIK